MQRIPLSLVIARNNNMAAAVGLLVFQNFWFWYPLTNFISLALTPTTLIALNKDLKMPKMQFRSNAKPSAFAYPQPLQPEKEKKREKVETAVLSITAKQRKKEADKKHHKEQQQRTKEGASKEEKMEVDTTDANKEAKPTTSTSTESKEEKAGILMVLDKRPQEAEVLVELVHGHGPTGARTATASSSGGTEEEEEEEEGYYQSTVVTIQDGKLKTDVEMDDGAGISEAKRSKRKHVTSGSGGRRTVKGAHTEPSPPKSFLFVDEEEGNAPAESQPSQGTSAAGGSSGAASHEPMEVEPTDPKNKPDRFLSMQLVAGCIILSGSHKFVHPTGRLVMPCLMSEETERCDFLGGSLLFNFVHALFKAFATLRLAL
ncbi:unnamed protein product [Echinostoma caproni]|uniref:RPN2_C domain-containing protein n=1 Tax=Echinostoma caproni TaxID=27848 RepID=A0A183ANS2_9TREM|nr:unnamed protein product [Echinostoma caproni]